MDRLFRVKKTQLSLASKRGYDITDELQILEMTQRQFERHINYSNEPAYIHIAMSSTYIRMEDNNRVLLAFYLRDTGSDKASVASINDLIDRITLFSEENPGIEIETLAVGPSPMNTTGYSLINEYPQFNITYMMESDLMYDPTEHILTPKHVKMTQQEKDEVKNALKIRNDGDFPWMMVNDPIAMFLGFKVGDMIYIERDEPEIHMVDVIPAYRIVRPAPPKKS